METPTLVTDRLLIRPLRLEDAGALYPMFHDPLAMRYWHSPVHLDVETTRAELALWLSPKPNAHFWAICLRENERPIGVIYYLDTSVLSPGMAYLLHPDFWQQGFMTEAARAVVAYGFSDLHLDRVELWIQEGNLASQRLARALGFTRRGGSNTTLVYGLYRHEWDPSRPLPASLSQRFDALYPVFIVSDVAATADYYESRLGFSLEWIFGDPPAVAMVARREWSWSGVRILLRRGKRPVARRGALMLMEQDDQWSTGKRYLDMATYGQWRQTADGDRPGSKHRSVDEAVPTAGGAR